MKVVFAAPLALTFLCGLTAGVIAHARATR